MSRGDPTVDPQRVSWLPIPDSSGFPLQNLPYGVFAPPGEMPRVGVAIGEHVLDLAAVAAAGLLDDAADRPAELFAAPSLNRFLAAGSATWGAVRRRVSALLTAGNVDLADRGLDRRALFRQDAVEPRLPCEVGDYVDFYSCLEHATNLGRIMRPHGDPLLPNWRHLPVGYHGRAGTIVVSGTPVRRPLGQQRPADVGAPPRFGPSRMLDFELEVGFLTGPANALGEPIPADRAAEHIFGLVLVNDWSARDIQAWEYQPLGPFLGKSFATSISAWVVPLDALAPFWVPAPTQDPPVEAHLRADGDWALDLHLEVALTPAGADEHVVARTSFRHLYWTLPQQLAHLTSNGATVRPGDLCASGTVSGPTPDSRGSLIELTWGGEQPLVLGDRRRTYLEDGDTVVLRGHCGGGGDAPRIGFGPVRGRILPAEQETT